MTGLPADALKYTSNKKTSDFSIVTYDDGDEHFTAPNSFIYNIFLATYQLTPWLSNYFVSLLLLFMPLDMKICREKEPEQTRRKTVG